MATLYLGLDSRNKQRIDENTRRALCIRVTHKRKPKYIDLGIALTASQWDEGTNQVINYPNAKRETIEVDRKWSSARAFLLKAEPILPSLTVEALTELIEKEINRELIEQQQELASQLRIVTDEAPEKPKSALLGEYGQIWINLKWQHGKRKTALWYKDSISSFLYYLKGNYEEVRNRWGEGENIDVSVVGYDLPMMDITPAMLDQYMIYCKDVLKHKVNAIGARMRGVRAIIGKAIKERKDNVLPKDFVNPFKFVTIRTQRTAKRGLTKKQMQDIREYPYEYFSAIWHHRNYFLLMFNMKGMNWIDIAKLRRKQINNGRLEYIRSKNGRYYNIKLTKEAEFILAFYIGNKGPEDYVFPILPNVLKDDANEISRIAENARHIHNDYLKDIAKDCKIPMNLTSYCTRHAWADIAKKMGESVEKISEGLGHEKLSTTQIYLDDFAGEEMDEMNDRVTAA